VGIVLLPDSRYLAPTIMEGGGLYRQRAAELLTEDFALDPTGGDYPESSGLPPEEPHPATGPQQYAQFGP